MTQKDRYCSYCGGAFAEDQAWPRTCTACARITYRNPVPVGVVLLPVDRGLLVIRRGIEPGRGQLALPGGYMDMGETWQEAVTREVREETGILLDPEGIELFHVCSATPGNTLLLVFGLAPKCRASELPEFVPSEEATERLILRQPAELAFSSHTEVMSRFFARRRRRR
jgi:8-oxo-dGTP pyrophosphatase MutT (NUDIX family)